jgi:hypothetical protein
MLNSRSVYLPALAASMVDKKDILHKNGKSFKFYRENGQFYYPKFLCSAGTNLAKTNFSKDLSIDLSKTLFLGDSGGYQLVTGVLKHSTELVDKILNWLEENTNYAMNIDYPPFACDREEYERRLNITVDNFKYFKENAKNKTKLMGVLHGPDFERMKTWYERIKDFQFDGGWGMGSIRGGNIFYYLLNFFFLKEKGEFERLAGKKALIHFLGFSRVKDMPVLLYLQHKLNKEDKDITVTFDSSYPFLTATYGHYFLNCTGSGFKIMTISSKIVSLKESINLDVQLPCNCPICKNVTFKDILANHYDDESKEKSIFYLYLGVHNLYRLLENKYNCENIIFTECRSLYDSAFTTKTNSLINIIDQAFEQEHPAEFIQKNQNVISALDEPDEDLTLTKTKLSSFFGEE